MEMKSTTTIINKCFLCCLLWCCSIIIVNAQPFAKTWTVKDGKMYITLHKNISAAQLDSIVNQYGLTDLDLKTFFVKNNPDSLHKLGWTININDASTLVLSKPMQGFDNTANPADKIVFTQKQELNARFAPLGNQVHFGYNSFKNKYPFLEKDSAVTFFLRGFSNAQKVMLAGSFNNWQPNALAMTKTDSGWIAEVKLGMGKYWYKFITDGQWIVDKDNNTIENDGEGNDNSVYYKTNYIFSLAGYTSAKNVFLSGSFNDWRKKELRMQRTANGWQLPVFISEGTHTYRFIADGKWMEDPANNNKLPNEYNEFNSVLQIGTPYLFTLNGYTTANKVTLMGSFNNWREDELLMRKTITGWELPYTLGPGNYQYRLKIDGAYTADSITHDNMVLIIKPNYTFRLKGFDSAATVCVAGVFNDWNPQSFRMKREGDEWVFKVHFNDGKHLYKFIVDGKWILDPANKLWEENEHGTGNSILWITAD